MWTKRCAAALILITVAAVGAVSPAAEAGEPGDTLLGDYNADGLQDSAVLGSISPNLCSTIIEYGRSPGVYEPPVAYTYLTPNGGGAPNCPDIGVALNVDDDPAAELWVGWSRGAPPTLDFNQLVLQPPAFAPSATYAATITAPTFIGQGRFSADGRSSPYVVGPGGMVNYIIEGSTVTPGPIYLCSLDTPTAQLANWTQDGVEGALVSYTNGCGDGGNGVVRIRRTGAVSHLEFDSTGRTRWTARVVNANDDRFPDVRTINQTSGEVSYFVNTQVGGAGLLVRAPRANTDRVDVTGDKALTIDVLANDHVSRYAEVTITAPPRYGTAQVLSDRRIVYRPNPTHGRTDRFTYQLTEEGKRSTATATIRFQ